MFLKTKKHIVTKMTTFFLTIIILTGSAPHIFGENSTNTAADISCIDASKFMNSFSPEKIKEQLILEINTYINRAPEIFEFDNNLTEKVDNKILCFSLMQLNLLFNKYKGFTQEFINYHKQNNTKFHLKLGTHGVDMMYNCDMVSNRAGAIIFSPTLLKNALQSIYTITHEFGHLVEYMVVHHIYNLLYNKCNNLEFEVTNTTKKHKEATLNVKEIKKLFNISHSLEDKQKLDEALSKSKEIKNRLKTVTSRLEGLKLIKLEAKSYFYYPAFPLNFIPFFIKNTILQGIEVSETHVSEYGDSSPQEFFAEAFAHMECTDNVGKVGMQLEDYLVNEMCYLPKENSIFNK